MVSVYPILSNVFTSQITLGTFLLLWIINICCKMKLLNLRTESKLKFQPKEYVHCAYLLSYKYYISNAPSLGLGNFFQHKFKFWKNSIIWCIMDDPLKLSCQNSNLFGLFSIVSNSACAACGALYRWSKSNICRMSKKSSNLNSVINSKI